MLGDDLFPKNFIYCLDAPSNYLGADKIFLDDKISSQVLREISDADDYVPFSHNRHSTIPDLPPSAKRAIQTFILARAIRCIRKHSNKHCSMMLNVSRFVDIQKQIREHVSYYLSEIKNAIFSNYRRPVKDALRNSVMLSLNEHFNHEFSNCPENWNDTQLMLHEAAEDVKIYLVNSKSDEALDYSKYDETGDALTALAIGGLSLSRGLTLEGLTVSYMYRNSKMYDTLMQMGRWFGYRPGYEDLCRVYLSEESQGWYAHITEATEDLRQQIKQMRRDGFSPKDFGLYVRAHPDTLIVTALNKMRNATKMTFKVSFDGVQRETFVLPADAEINRKNLNEMTKLYEKLREGVSKPIISEYVFKGSTVWRKVPLSFVLDFVGDFSFHRELQGLKDAFLRYAREVSDTHPDWDIAFITLVGSGASHEKLPMAVQERQVGRINGLIKAPRIEAGWYVGNKQKVSGRYIEGVGLDKEEIKRALRVARENRKEKPGDTEYRHKDVRGRPLLMLHLLELCNKTDEHKEIIAEAVPAVGFSFPATGQYRSVDCVVNKVWLENDMIDSPDEEDDYDI